MIIGEILYPNLESPRKKIKCNSCEISYSNKSYKNLIDNYKLLYLVTYSTEVKFSACCLCHDCFFDNLSEVYKDHEPEETGGLSFFIFNDESELELNFHPEDYAPEGLEDVSEEVYMEDFIKDILEA